MNLTARVRRVLRWAWPATPEHYRVYQEAKRRHREASRRGLAVPLPLDAWGEPLGVKRKHPNDDVARAIDALFEQIPPGLRCDFRTLSADTVRVSLHGFDRIIDITRQVGRDRCDVKVYTFTPGSLETTAAHSPDTTTMHDDVALTELGALLARPRPGSTDLLFTPRSQQP